MGVDVEVGAPGAPAVGDLRTSPTPGVTIEVQVPWGQGLAVITAVVIETSPGSQKRPAVPGDCLYF